jgi:predicted lipase
LESIKLVSYKNISGIDVGEGFYDEWNKLKSKVISAVNVLNATYPSYDIWVSGHSLGAAISVLCALELAEVGYSYQRIHVYNYGLPRVGNQNFSDYYTALVSEFEIF